MYDVSIHALLAECDPQSDLPRHASTVSIHALLAECDVSMIVSTFPLRSATSVLTGAVSSPPVSIHALLAECDK